ncbi:N-acetylglucosamine kinase-like BadF-type ATPase [Crossiella equi]|uniref:N-acetylglucosamine kinase-like BadF-type ATPase n=1 Tax=Crossiella equi TaxID=130796 RepID=A0ABS5AFL0_9PSEU|nr:BadF/BadG/BcrA/BcrD ATPase family protein [Crossiella equi]MBP2475122.1 N-acetylglucosamine kinase-like BadF-type ATPase [Crossiella equi]
MSGRPEISDLVLAIDGGNSKTDVMLVTRDGQVLSQVRGPGSPPQTVGMKQGLDTFEGLIVRAAREAGYPGEAPFAAHTSAFLAGADLPKEERFLQEAISERGWSATTMVANDTFALLRAGSPTGHGVAVVCGAGINGVGVAPDGRVHRYPALGRISGDWGGGAHLGSEALWLAVRAEDGRGRPTALLPAIKEHFAVPNLLELIERLHFGELGEDVLHELSPLLFRVAAAGDEVAQEVVDRLAEEVSLLATVSLRSLGLTEDPVDIVLGGGVLTGVGAALVEEVGRRCKVVAPLAVIHVVDVPPVAGAALAGLDALGADRGAEVRLRAALLTPAASESAPATEGGEPAAV